MAFSAPAIGLSILWAMWVLTALWCWRNQYMFRRKLRRQEHRHETRPVDFQPPVAVIIPVKGADARFELHLDALLRLDYPAYRLIFTVQSPNDPAYAAVADRKARFEREGAASSCRGIDLVVAGPAERGSQKVHNQLAAVARLEPADEAVVFTDADAVPPPDWLDMLVRPLRRERVGASTGYRWLVPADHALPSRLASVMNASVATLFGPARYNHAWGGSMAILQSVMREVDLVGHWRGAYSDDYQLTRAVSRAGRSIYFNARCLLASPATFTWRSLFEFGVRQYVVTFVHAPAVWTLALLTTWGYTAGWVTMLLAAGLEWDGFGWGLAAGVAVTLFDQGRAAMRRGTARLVFDDNVLARLKSAFMLEHVATPLWMAVHGLIVLRSLLRQRIGMRGLYHRVCWAGIGYLVRGRQDVVVESRDG